MTESILSGRYVRSGGILVPERLAAKRGKPKAFSLFSGCGGFDLGMIQAGFEVVGGNEFEEAAAITYMVNLGSYPMTIHYVEGEKDKERLNKSVEKLVSRGGQKGKIVQMPTSGSGWIRSNPEYPPVRNFWFGDVRKLTGKMILDALGMQVGELACVFGGPPCQGFSYSGKREIADPRNNLVYEFGRLIVELQPQTFVMENVPGIASMMDPDGAPVLDKFALMLQEGGYGVWDNIKKAMLTQNGCAGVIKSKPVKLKGKSRPKQQTMAPEADQLSLFDEAVV